MQSDYGCRRDDWKETVDQLDSGIRAIADLSSSSDDKRCNIWLQRLRRSRISNIISLRSRMPQPTKAIISNEQKSGIRKGSNRASTGKVGALLLSVYI